MDLDLLTRGYSQLIRRITYAAASRRSLSRTEREILEDFVLTRLVEHDFALIRKFRNRSSISTFLTAVIEKLSLDFCVLHWDEWQPSPTAARYGPNGVLLERLILRDQQTLRQAIGIARREHGVTQTPAQLRALWARMQPTKSRRG